VQLVGDQDGEVLVPVCGWTEWLSSNSVTLAGIKKYLEFYFTKEKIGMHACLNG
jgi:hypothetical protein